MATVPVIVQANAGLPDIVNGQAIYNVDSEEFFIGVEKFVQLGASIIGGCCGTNPEFIKKISDNISTLKKVEIEKNNSCVVCSPSKFVEIKAPTVIGERLNPTGRKLLKESLINENLDYIINLGLEQIEGGADILNVNVGLPDIDEKKMMPKVIKEMQSVMDVPLQVDSSNIEALEQGLRYYNGKTIANSVNGKEESLNAILPIVKKYGACIVGLTLDEKGIPSTAEGRFKIAEKIVNKALFYGIKKEDIFIDCLSLTVSAQQEEALETLKCIKMVKEKLGVKTILGVSNISFGVPNRKALNNTYLNCVKYIEKYSGYKQNNIIKTTNDRKYDLSLESIVEHGLKENAKEATLNLLKKYDENYVLDEILIPSLDVVGKKYDKGEIFLPQLIQSAETVKVSLNTIKDSLAKNNTNTVSKGKIIVATVKGDIHDIGKNIVKIMLENYGYEVIDLGKDVPIEEVVNHSKKNNIQLVGLSALMTTTVHSMKETIDALRKAGLNTKIFVGGAVLTEEYAKDIGADYYSKDAKSAVEIAKLNFN